MRKKQLYSFLVVIYSIVIPAVIVLTYWGNRTVTVIAEETPREYGTCIVIDPGHGGEDGGAISCTGIPESKYNLEISLKLDSMLHLMGYDTLMIRSDDTSIYVTGNSIAQKKVSDLKERVRIINSTKNALLVSIHQNYFHEGQYSGAQVFYAPTEGSRELAQKLQAAVIGTVNPGSSRKCKRAEGIYIMEHIDCTAVLIECGFLSNWQEEAKLRSKDYQLKLCSVIASTLGSAINHDTV